MCGLAAIFSREPSGSQRAALDRALDALSHRGPDGRGDWASPGGRLALGHTRLSLVDLRSSQPIASEDGRFRLIANGEFYGHAAIRRDLEARGHRFRTRTDSEIALHLYEEKQARCLEDLRGEFAFILWDEARQTLFAARDRFGIKPLFYARVGGALYCASEAKALFAAGLPAAWDHEQVYQILHGCYRADRSLFENVHALPPGHYLVANPGAFGLVRYWEPAYPRRPRPGPAFPEAECIEQARSLLDEAVRLRMQADVPVGCLLSGGLDSSLALGLAARQSPRPVAAFTIAFDQQDYDESAQARAAAQHAGAELRVVPASDADLADHMADSAWHGEMIQYNAHGTARYLLSRAIRAAGFRAVIGGEGADELFAGYRFVREAVLASAAPQPGRSGWLRRAAALLRPLSAAEKQVASSSRWLAHASRLLRLPPGIVELAAQALGTLRGLLAPEFRNRFERRDPYLACFRRIYPRLAWLGPEPAKVILYGWLRSIFVNYHLAADRLDMAHAVEVRLPYLDHKLFEYARGIPVALLAKEGRQKHVLREAARPFVPEAIYCGPKRPFMGPPLTLRPGGRVHDLAQSVLRGEVMAAQPIFDRRAVAALLDRLPGEPPERRKALDPLIMALVSVALLHERFRL
jgi:asparagine synthase (glutamine-hydrolysing)